MQTQLVVIGGGPGGYAAAFLAADEGMDVVLVEAEGKLGGLTGGLGGLAKKRKIKVVKGFAKFVDANTISLEGDDESIPAHVGHRRWLHRS